MALSATGACKPCQRLSASLVEERSSEIVVAAGAAAASSVAAAASPGAGADVDADAAGGGGYGAAALFAAGAGAGASAAGIAVASSCTESYRLVWCSVKPAPVARARRFPSRVAGGWNDGACRLNPARERLRKNRRC